MTSAFLVSMSGLGVRPDGLSTTSSSRSPHSKKKILRCASNSDKRNGMTTRRAVLQTLIGMGTALFTTTGLPQHAAARVTVADQHAGETVTRTDSGLEYYDFIMGSGKEGAPMVSTGNRVTVHYTLGTTGARNGWRIESSVGREPLTFRVGAGDVVKGLEEGVVGMREGGRRRLLIPAPLGYHSAQDRPVPTGFAEFQRFKNIYLNPDRPYKPDVVMDVTLLRIK